MQHLWVSCFLFVALFGPVNAVSGGRKEGEVWSAVRYPKEELGPDSWRYYRVELPLVFSLLSVSLARNWQYDDNGSSTISKVPLVCFGFHGPPLTVAPRNSMLDAVLVASASQNASVTGECAWFNDTVEVNVTNLEVRSGTLHVGIFSDAQATRTQSKMIPRGKKYTFGLGIQVFWCGTENLGGPECNLGIGSLPPPMLSKSLYSMNTLHDDRPFLSSRSSRSHLDKEFVAQSRDDLISSFTTHLRSESSHPPKLGQQPNEIKDNDLMELRNRTQVDYAIKASQSGWSDWASSSQQCNGLNEKQFFSLDVVEFLQELEIRYDCVSNISHGISKCEEFESTVKEGRIPLLHLRYGGLPGKNRSDFRGEPSTGSITIAGPRRGRWYLSIFNPMVTSSQEEEEKEVVTGVDELCLTLMWRVRTCGPGLTGNDCQWPVLHLEVRIQASSTFVVLSEVSVDGLFYGQQ